MIIPVLICALFATCSTTANYSLGVIAANKTHVFCVTFKRSWFTAPIPRSRDTAIPHPLYHASELNGCRRPAVGEFQGKGVVIVDSAQCGVEERVQNVVNTGGAALLVIGRVYNQLNITKVTASNFSSVPIVLVNSDSLKALEQLEIDKVNLTFYTPYPGLDGSVFLIYFLCVFCIVVGSYLSIYPKNLKISELWTTTPKPPIRLTMTTVTEDEQGALEEESDEKAGFCKNLLFGLVIVAIMVGMLLGTYYAYDYFVFFFIFLFCIISTSGLYTVLSPFLAMCDSQWRVKRQLQIGNHKKTIYFFRVFIWLLCLSVAIVWFVYRKDMWIWPVQVLLGVCVCLNILVSVPMPNLKIIAIIMALLFIYDIFFVFITPLFTHDKMSIMEKVATGRSGGDGTFDAPKEYEPIERIPLSISVPYFQKCDLKTCSPLYSLIGFGDIAIPGLLTTYAIYFDTLAHPGQRMWYYITTCLCYSLGLIVTYVALIFMNVAQPALLYLVPFTLIPLVVVAWRRGELRAMWTGRAGPAAQLNSANDENLQILEH